MHSGVNLFDGDIKERSKAPLCGLELAASVMFWMGLNLHVGDVIRLGTCRSDDQSTPWDLNELWSRTHVLGPC
jgi:hypothetical protein